MSYVVVTLHYFICAVELASCYFFNIWELNMPVHQNRGHVRIGGTLESCKYGISSLTRHLIAQAALFLVAANSGKLMELLNIP